MPSAARSRDTYHHGALRQTLLEGARELLAEKGEEGFSLSELARRAGVSTAAPYRHFEDRQALLNAVADTGYEELRAALLADAGAAGDPADALIRMGISYVRFAVDHPALFGLMFRARPGAQSPLGPPSFQPLVEAVAAAQRDGTLPSGEPPHLAARAVWATVHGVATLRLSGGFDKLGLGDTVENLVRGTLALALHGRPGGP
ncbi:TetR/AcrR family transcriptional regulator [Streptomyces aidingensis]|nr:TetR/AcrR family transcriptional regulator [Streptomyces aidingensis]